MKSRLVLVFAVLFIFSACGSPTEPEVLPSGPPSIDGPSEVFGEWQNYMIVCTVPMTITAPSHITILSGSVEAVFPAEGNWKAKIDHNFTGEDLETLWGSRELQGVIDGSLQIFPLVQFEDYRVSLKFHYQSPDPEVEPGVLEHEYICRPSPDDLEPRP